MNKFFIVTKREYLKVVKKKTFWISTLIFPLIVLVVGGISAISSNITDTRLADTTQLNDVYIIDNAKIIEKKLFEGASIIFVNDNIENLIQKVKIKEIESLIYFPENLLEEKKIYTYINSDSIIKQASLDILAKDIVNKSGLSRIQDETTLKIITSTFENVSTVFENGEKVVTGLERFIVPIIAIAIYFILTTFATNYLLLSVSEEKENRVMEVILTTIKPKELIIGKIFGQLGVVITQVLFLIVLSIIAIYLTRDSIPFTIDLSSIQLDPLIIIPSLLYSLLSFFIIACIMVGVGSAMPNYKDAQSFSGIFIFLAIVPIYFITLIATDPNGNFSTILSNLPLIGGIVLLLRTTLGSVDIFQSVISIGLLLFYSYIAIILAFKLFELGSLEYSKTISIRSIFQRRKKLSK